MTEIKRRGRPVGQKSLQIGHRPISLNTHIYERFQAAHKLEGEKYPFDISMQQFFTVLLDLYDKDRSDSSVG